MIVFALAAASAIWYFLPKTFLSGVEPSDIKSIAVFDGNTGKGFDINDADEIRYIIENIQGIKMERDNISIGYLGGGAFVCISMIKQERKSRVSL